MLPTTKLAVYISAQSSKRYIIYFLLTDYEVIVIRVLNQSKDAGRRLSW